MSWEEVTGFFFRQRVEDRLFSTLPDWPVVFFWFFMEESHEMLCMERVSGCGALFNSACFGSD